MDGISCSMHHIPCIIFHASYSMHYVPCIMFHASYSIHHVPCILFHASYSMHHIPCILFHASYSMHHIPCIIFHASYSMHSMRQYSIHSMRHIPNIQGWPHSEMQARIYVIDLFQKHSARNTLSRTLTWFIHNTYYRRLVYHGLHFRLTKLDEEDQEDAKKRTNSK